MTRDEKLTEVVFRSGPPWHLELRIDGLGPDLVCRLEGGTRHVGAVALGWWDGPELRVAELVAGSHREGPLAAHVAERLSRAARATATCVAGIHFDGLGAAEIEEICAAAEVLAERAARSVDGESGLAGGDDADVGG